MELCLMFCASLDGRGVWGRMDTRVHMTEFLSCSPETTTSLLMGYTPIQNKKFKVWNNNKNNNENKKKELRKCLKKERDVFSPFYMKYIGILFT